MNDELRHRSHELNDMNNFLETVLTTIGMAVVVLDGDQRVRIWNGQARELWGLTEEETEGRPLLSLDIGLPLAKLRRPLTSIISGKADSDQIMVDATNRRGRDFQCRVTLLRLNQFGADGAAAAVMMMESVEHGD